MEFKANPKLDAALAALENDMIETLQRWIRVPSVRAERSADNAPFGAEVRRALDVAMEDIAIRQTMLGGSYPLYTEDSDSYKVPLYAVKARMTPLFYAYVQQAHAGGFSVLWSDWLAAGEAEDPAA